jgi:hypothetical protein
LDMRMALNLQTYCAIRPMVFHDTATSNLAGIRGARALHSVGILSPDCDDVQRSAAVVLVHGQIVITLRDQLALQKGHVELTGGWCWEDLIVALNTRVFFWPGTHGGPIGHGRRLIDAYGRRHHGRTLLRVGFQELLQANSGTSPYFCRFNSGAPRTVQGRRSPRGPDTFLLAHEWPYSPSHIVEVSFIRSVSLPPTTDLWDGARAWQRL